MSGHTTRQVAELIGLTTDQVRHFARRGLVAPARGERDEYLFSFQDVVLMRTAKGLVDANVSTRRALAVLDKLRSELTEVRALSSLRIYADGSNVVVRDDEAVWDIESGQGHFDFAVRELADNVATLRAHLGADGAGQVLDGKEFEDLDSDDWYNLGLELEEVDPENAPEAYARSIGLDPQNADAHVNLGRLFQLRGDLKRAKRHYQLALAAVPTHQLAHYNMGTVFDELDEIETAQDFYRKAPSVPDAHYNLARIFELRGDELSSLRHLRQYRQLLDSE